MNIYFGQDRTFCFSTIDEINLYLKIPILEGYSIIHYSSELGKNYTEQDFNLLQTNSQLMGVSTVPITYPLEDIAYKTYLSLLELTQDWNLCRIGNYVPYINDESNVGFSYVLCAN
ncbi:MULTISPECIES: hypothetical protein [unclassified Okeania]|uniref:hypothetical protein n=1 Tax=unclassified Okeania TaxID=2634635 RepID=UPI0013B84149|nr:MULTISPECIES: hypothetical protein [unclassified Okeania]NES79868.1 hypothetical protein [Okeania sp. SIO1H4]NET15763.1 hypothetical protein [Okeania sp. SIO1H6]NET22447.1 hypothetical protein [Okeania sp. SIO1H5]NET97075.1 hypothetical protein [Okeania sp. SIO1H2]